MNAVNFTQIEPFWNRLPRIAAYPLRGSNLLALIALTLGRLLGYLPAGGFLMIGLLFVTYHVAFGILRDTAHGHIDSAGHSFSVGGSIVLKFLGLYFIIGLIAVIIAIAIKSFLPSYILIILLGPAATMSLAMDEDILNALRPATLFGIITRVGWPYLAVVGLLFVFQSSADFAVIWAWITLPGILGDLVHQLLSVWGLFATFHLMGYLLFQYHQQLGYTPDVIAQSAPAINQLPSDPLLNSATALVEQGKVDEALALLAEEINSRAMPLATHDLYHRLLLRQSDTARLIQHSAQYLHLLSQEPKRRLQLFSALQAYLSADPNYAPADIETASKWVEQSKFAGQSQLTLNLSNRLLQTNPRHPDAPNWGLTAATLLFERFGEVEQAIKLAQQASERCQDPKLKDQIDGFLAVIQPQRR